MARLLLISSTLFLVQVLICNENLVLVRARAITAAVNVNNDAAGESDTAVIPFTKDYLYLQGDTDAGAGGLRQRTRKRNTILLFPDRSTYYKSTSVNNTNSVVTNGGQDENFVDVSFPRTRTLPLSTNTKEQRRQKGKGKTKRRETVVGRKSPSIIHHLGDSLQIISANGSRILSPHPHPQQQQQQQLHKYESEPELMLNDTDSAAHNGDDIHDHEQPQPGTTTTETWTATAAAQIFTFSADVGRVKRSNGVPGDRVEDFDKSLRLFLFLGGLAISFFVLIFISTMICFCCPFCLIAKRAQRQQLSIGGSLGGSGPLFQSSSGPETTFTVTGPVPSQRSSSMQMNTSPLLGSTRNATDRRASSYQQQQFQQHRSSMIPDTSGGGPLLTVTRSPRPSTSAQGARLSVSGSLLGAGRRASVMNANALIASAELRTARSRQGYNVLPYGFDPAVLPSTLPPPPQSPQTRDTAS